MRTWQLALVSGLMAAVPVTASAADMASADIIGIDNRKIGKATLEQTPTGVLIFLEVGGLTPGGHGIHLHSVGTCEPNFKASKGHINPDGKKHGLRNPEGPDNGDLTNIYVSEDGTVTAEIFTTRVSLSGDGSALLDGDGAAIVIHANPDDHMAQPIGGAGGRVGCGVIKKM